MPDGALSRTEEITQVLRDEILRGQYRPGERLPSERDIAARFETSRGTVREAYKKLEQLGIVSIQPGGARVVPVEECTLDVLGPLMQLDDVPDPSLLDATVDVGAVLMRYAAELAVEKGDPARLAKVEGLLDEALAAGPDALAQARSLALAFVEASDNLVLLLIVNGLRIQVEEPTARAPMDPKALREIAGKLKAAVRGRDAALTGALMKELVELRRTQLKAQFGAHGRDMKEAVS